MLCQQRTAGCRSLGKISVARVLRARPKSRCWGNAEHACAGLIVGHINKRLGIFEVKATTAAALGIATVKDRRAVHMPETGATRTAGASPELDRRQGQGTVLHRSSQKLGNELPIHQARRCVPSLGGASSPWVRVPGAFSFNKPLLSRQRADPCLRWSTVNQRVLNV